MSGFGKLLLVIIMFMITFFVGLLQVYVVLSIATLYALTFITQYSFLQILGLLIIIGLIKYEYKKSEDSNLKFSDAAIASITRILTDLTVILTVWGLAFIYHWLVS